MRRNFDRALGAEIEKAMKDGLMAENMEDYPAPRSSTRRRAGWIRPTRRRCATWVSCIAIRPATGTRRATTFEAILEMPADPLSRAVALHGLGKMTIHDGEFLKGLHLMEESRASFRWR